MRAVSAIALATVLGSASCFAPSSTRGIKAFGTTSTRSLELPSLKLVPNDNSHQDSFFPFEEKSSSSSSSSKMTLNAKTGGPNEEASDGSGGVRQLLGLKGASAETNIWKIRLQLTKPVTWVPLVWGVMCGAAASGNYHWMWNPFDPNDRDIALGFTDACKGFVGMILAGPFLTGYTQTINDWYDREIDGKYLFSKLIIFLFCYCTI